MAAIKSPKTQGLHTALEGDIEAAYDRVTKETMLKGLEDKISDRKFIDLIRQRLDYDYVDTLDNKTH
mgnify:CR=1 FL=1